MSEPESSTPEPQPEKPAFQLYDGADLKLLWCSFCDKSQEDPTMKLLVAGPSPRPAFICDECAIISHELIIEQRRIAANCDTAELNLWLQREYESLVRGLLPAVFPAERGWNYCEIRCAVGDIGPVVLTLQRVEGKTS